MCLGAAPGQVAVGDSTTVLLYKLMRAAVAARPGRTEIVLDRDNFPTDRYVADGVARECGLTLRWIDVDTVGRGDRRPAGRCRHRADGAGRAEPRRVPLGVPGRRRGAHPHRARRGGAGALGPVPLRRLGAGRARRLGGGPRGRVHLQVPQRRARRAGLLLRRGPAPRRADPADPGLDGRHRPVPDGAGLHADPRHPPVPVRHPGRRRDDRGGGHGRAPRRGRDGRRPREVGRAHRARHRAGRRGAGAAGRGGRVAASVAGAGRPRDAGAPGDAGGRRPRSGSGT